MDSIGNSYLSWSVLLVLGVPICIIVLNELIARLPLRLGDYVSVLRFVRDLVLPLLVLLMVLRLVFSIDAESIATNLISTLFWTLLIVTVFRLSLIFLGNGEYEPGDYRSKIPPLFLRLPPYALIGVIAFHVIQNVWALPIQEMATTLGIGSIAIAFALQTTLSNLVSGVLLVANSPFKNGDWITVGDVEGQIVDVSWRYTHIKNWNGDLVIIPNGAISDEYIENHSRPSPNTVVAQNLSFDFTTPPNVVKRMLYDTIGKTPGILQEPGPTVSVAELDNPSITYCIEFWINDYEAKPDILEDCLTRIWYAAQREGIAVPVPSQEVYAQRGAAQTRALPDTTQLREERLRSLPGFAHLPADKVAAIVENSAIKHYAATERITDAGAWETGLSIVTQGAVRLEIDGTDGVPVLLDQVDAGELFGETGLFGRPVSPVSVIADDDCELLLVTHSSFNKVLETDATLTDEVNSLINRRSRPSQQQKQALAASSLPENDGVI